MQSKTHTYNFININNTDVRTLVMGAKDEYHACSLFCEAYDEIYENFDAISNVLTTVFNKWYVIKVR